jgi:ABC-type maltose transport system permease subunit
MFFTVAAILFSVVTLYPFIFSVIASLRNGLDVYSTGWSLSDLTLYSYKKILFGFSDDESIHLTRWLLNTAFVSIITTVLTSNFCFRGYALED